MCGIAGVIGSSAMAKRTRMMLEAIQHRGPDQSEIAETALVSLGNCRLRIRTTSIDQPLTRHSNPDSIASFNGQVYGRHRPDGSFDPVMGGTPEIAALLDSESNGSLSGMYALAVARAQGVELRRDPFGIKPLFWARLKSGFAFASELPALIRGSDGTSLEPRAVAEFLAFGRVLGNRTLLQEIKRVPCGGRVFLTSKDALSAEPPPHSEVTFGATSSEVLRWALHEAVAQTTETLQPLGLAISGGLDSTILASELNDLGIERCTTISICNREDGVRTLEQLGLPGNTWLTWKHHAALAVDRENYRRSLRVAVRCAGEPTVMSSVPLYHQLAREAKIRGVTVLLVGEGADELFGGYDSYRQVCSPSATNEDLEDFLLPDSRLRLIAPLLTQSELLHVITEAAKQSQPIGNESIVETHLRNEMYMSLEPLLWRTDSALMAYSIEGRTPFLHGNVPALARCYTRNILCDGKNTKIPLRSAYAEVLPSSAWRSKRPFRAPLAYSLDVAPNYWRVEVEAAVIQLECLRLNGKQVLNIFDQAVAGNEQAVSLIIALLSLADWVGWAIAEGVNLHGE